MNEKKETSGRVEVGSVRFYKRLIVGVLSVVLIGLLVSCAVFAVRNHGLEETVRSQEATIRRLKETAADQKAEAEALRRQLREDQPADGDQAAAAEVSRSMRGREASAVDFDLLTRQINEGQNPPSQALSVNSAVVPAAVFTAISNRADEMTVGFAVGDYYWSAKSLEVYRPKLAASYDLSASVETLSAEEASAISIPQMKAALRLSVASEQLPRTIRLTFDAGAEYAGRTLYLYHRDASGDYEYGGSAAADESGRVTLPVAYGKDNVITVLQ